MEMLHMCYMHVLLKTTFLDPILLMLYDAMAKSNVYHDNKLIIYCLLWQMGSVFMLNSTVRPLLHHTSYNLLIHPAYRARKKIIRQY
jgi:hypothetical protein